MRKWAVKFFDGLNELYRCVYASSCGFTVVDKVLLDSDEGDVIYQGKDREQVVLWMNDTSNATQAIIDMIRAFPFNK